MFYTEQVQKKYNIQQVADMIGLYKGTIKNYERKKIFPKPKRNPINKYREYHEEDIEILKRILIKGK
ncbi:MAG: MerR family transcriptional regulator [Candidatus Omnitrophica bacterium]|nr:MerR family transcriptional regulator [Candidatus Omnitrophota bacterium]